MASSEQHQDTIPLYLEDTFTFECTARVVGVTPGADAGAFDIVLDRTVFYPGGGGQPCDVGTISKPGGGATFTVEKAAPISADHHGVVCHSGKFSGHGSPQFSKGDEVIVKIDGERRVLNAKHHTGGHLLDACMELIGHAMEPTKGMHYPGQSYVGYSGDIAADSRAAAVARLNETAARLIAENGAVNVEMIEPEQACSRLGISQLPPYLPDGKQVRFITVPGQRVGYPCAGTHLKTLGQFKSLTVTKIQKRGKELRVSYTVS